MHKTLSLYLCFSLSVFWVCLWWPVAHLELQYTMWQWNVTHQAAALCKCICYFCSFSFPLWSVLILDIIWVCERLFSPGISNRSSCLLAPWWSPCCSWGLYGLQKTKLPFAAFAGIIRPSLSLAFFSPATSSCLCWEEWLCSCVG